MLPMSSYFLGYFEKTISGISNTLLFLGVAYGCIILLLESLGRSSNLKGF